MILPLRTKNVEGTISTITFNAIEREDYKLSPFFRYKEL